MSASHRAKRFGQSWSVRSEKSNGLRSPFCGPILPAISLINDGLIPFFNVAVALSVVPTVQLHIRVACTFGRATVLFRSPRLVTGRCL